MQINPYAQQSFAMSFGTMNGAFGNRQSSGFGGASLRINTPGTQSVQGGTTVSKTLADEMARRLEQNAITGTGKTDKAGESDKDPKNADKLASSLSSTFDYVRSEFGDQAATAVMGIFAKHIGEGDVSEKALGDAMLDSVRFMDRNFGFEDGDKLIGNFNRNLNQSVNDYFDNGFNEQIFAVSPGQKPAASSTISLTMNKAMSGLAEQVGEEDAQSVMDILTQALEEGDQNPASLRDSLKKGMQKIKDQYGGTLPESLQGLEGSLAEALSGATGATGAAPVKGAMLNVTI